jgi:hypothetical protein
MIGDSPQRPGMSVARWWRGYHQYQRFWTVTITAPGIKTGANIDGEGEGPSCASALCDWRWLWINPTWHVVADSFSRDIEEHTQF